MKKIFTIFISLVAVTGTVMGGIYFYQYKAQPNVATTNYEAYAPGFTVVNEEVIGHSGNYESVPIKYRDISLEANDNFKVSYVKKQATSSYEDLCMLGVNNEILYPGALLDIDNGEPVPMAGLKSGTVNLSANLETAQNLTTDNISIDVENPSTGSVREAIRTIIPNNINENTQLPGQISMEIKQVESEDELYMNFGLGLQVSKLNFADEFSYKKINKQTNIMVVFKQVYYTVDASFNDGRGIRSFFKNSYTIGELEDGLNGKMPAYVSSVSYGKIVNVLIKSNYSAEEIINELTIGWGKQSSNPGSTSNKKFSFEFENTINSIGKDSETEIKYTQYGGKASSNMSTLVSLGKNPGEVLASLFLDYSPNEDIGLPISYRIRHLSGEIVKIQDYNEYIVKRVEYQKKRILNWSALDKMAEDGTLRDIDALRLDFSAVAFNSVKDKSGAIIDNPVTEANKTVAIPTNIKTLIIEGPNDIIGADVIYKNLSFLIAPRLDEIKITLKDIYFSGDHGRPAISFRDNGQGTLNVEIMGSVSIIGSLGNQAIYGNDIILTGNGVLNIVGGAGANATNQSENGSDAAAAIIAKNVTVNMIGTVNVVGGQGGAGHKGNDSTTQGSTGWKREWVWQDRAGTGGIGGTGGKGTDGGNGGDAMIGTLYVNSGNCTFIGGKGGDGGKGGKGGKGGTGGNNTAWGGGTGNGGQGGTGGDGGNAGRGGSNSSLTYSTSSTGTLKILSGDNGLIGLGGDGGDGGDPGKANHMCDGGGKQGRTGDTGNPGIVK